MFKRLKPKAFALDLGTSKFCLAMLSNGLDTKPSELQFVSIPANGMKRGMLENYEEALTNLKILIERAENDFNEDILEVTVGVSGSHLSSEIMQKEINLQSGVITSHTVNTLKESIKYPAGEQVEILSTIPLNYKIDQRSWVDSPLGFSGKTLTGRYFVVKSDRCYLKDLIRLCNDSGLKIKQIVAEPVASAMSTLSPEQRHQGVVVLDIGGGTTDGIVYIEGKPTELITIDIGGFMMTRDLAIGLNVVYEDAERIKLSYGLKQHPDWDKARNILGSRVFELLQAIKIKLDPYRDQLRSGVVFTGGAAQLIGLEKFANNILNMPITVASPNLNNDKSKAFQTSYATAIGLLKYDQDLSLKAPSEASSRSFFSRYFHSISQWFLESEI